MFVASLSNLCTPTLARGESDGLSKLIFFGIILVVWAGAAIASSVKQAAAKRAAARTLRTNWQASSPAWTGVAPPPLPPAARRPQARRVIPPPPAPRQAFAPPPPLPLSASVDAPDRSSPNTAPADERGASPPAPTARSSAARASSIGAADIRRWLTPDVLRGQYFVTEVFDPPPGAVD